MMAVQLHFGHTVESTETGFYAIFVQLIGTSSLKLLSLHQSVKRKIKNFKISSMASPKASRINRFTIAVNITIQDVVLGFQKINK